MGAAKGKTSIGTGWLFSPRTLTFLLSSTTIMSFRDEYATIFSRASAPPIPLIRFSFSSTWSAPSIVKSKV